MYSSTTRKFVRWYNAPWVDEAYLPTTKVDMKVGGDFGGGSLACCFPPLLSFCSRAAGPA